MTGRPQAKGREHGPQRPLRPLLARLPQRLPKDNAQQPQQQPQHLRAFPPLLTDQVVVVRLVVALCKTELHRRQVQARLLPLG